jgi:hypothetical protein
VFGHFLHIGEMGSLVNFSKDMKAGNCDRTEDQDCSYLQHHQDTSRIDAPLDQEMPFGYTREKGISVPSKRAVNTGQRPTL